MTVSPAQAAPIDLRSDTVTRPTRAMLDAMLAAPLGDDVLGDDPTVRRLEERFAALVGKPAAVFVPTGTMGNQLAIRAQTEPGDEIIAHQDSHIVHYETGAPAALSGCMVRALTGARGQFSVEDVRAAVRPDNVHCPVSRLLVVENTQNRGGGSVWALALLDSLADAAHEAGLRAHLDGARLWNASVASGVPMARLAQRFDTVTCCFSKGLGAPVGSALAGPADTIARARRFRKMFGGAMRQSGLLAAAAIHAMDHHVERLREDHAAAAELGAALASMPGLSLAPEQASHGVETNIVYFDLSPSLRADAAGFCRALGERGVLMLPTAARRVRAVTHLDAPRAQVQRAAAVLKDLAASLA
jgi:threonine aldolase